MLNYEKLNVYQCSIQFLALAEQIAKKIPRGHGSLADQLRRAALSVPLNIAEASGKPGENDSGRSFVIARGSAMECAAVLDACRVLGFIPQEDADSGKGLLTRIVAMLSKLIKF